MQPKIKIKNPNNSYLVQVIPMLKKKKIEDNDNFFKTWK
jgi:hypothetical protein